MIGAALLPTNRVPEAGLFIKNYSPNLQCSFSCTDKSKKTLLYDLNLDFPGWTSRSGKRLRQIMKLKRKKVGNFIHVIYEEVFESRSLRLEYKFTFQIVFVYGDKTILFGSFYRSCTFKFSPCGLQGEKNLFAPARQDDYVINFRIQ